MDSLGNARDPVSRGRTRLHFPRSRPPVPRGARPEEPDRSDRPGRGPGDRGRDRPVLPRGVRGPRGDDRALSAHGDLPGADDRGDPCPLLPRPVRPRAVRPRGGLDFPGGSGNVALRGGEEAGLRADPAPCGVPRNVGRPDVPRRPGRGDRGPLRGDTCAPALLPPPIPETALRRVPGTCGRLERARPSPRDGLPPRVRDRSRRSPGEFPARSLRPRGDREDSPGLTGGDLPGLRRPQPRPARHHRKDPAQGKRALPRVVPRPRGDRYHPVRHAPRGVPARPSHHHHRGAPPLPERGVYPAGPASGGGAVFRRLVPAGGVPRSRHPDDRALARSGGPRRPAAPRAGRAPCAVRHPEVQLRPGASHGADPRRGPVHPRARHAARPAPAAGETALHGMPTPGSREAFLADGGGTVPGRSGADRRGRVVLPSLRVSEVRRDGLLRTDGAHRAAPLHAGGAEHRRVGEHARGEAVAAHGGGFILRRAIGAGDAPCAGW